MIVIEGDEACRPLPVSREGRQKLKPLQRIGRTYLRRDIDDGSRDAGGLQLVDDRNVVGIVGMQQHQIRLQRDDALDREAAGPCALQHGNAVYGRIGGAEGGHGVGIDPRRVPCHHLGDGLRIDQGQPDHVRAFREHDALRRLRQRNRSASLIGDTDLRGSERGRRQHRHCHGKQPAKAGAWRHQRYLIVASAERPSP